MIFIKLQINLSFQIQLNTTQKDEIKIYNVNSSDNWHVGLSITLHH